MNEEIKIVNQIDDAVEDILSHFTPKSTYCVVLCHLLVIQIIDLEN